MPNRTPPPVWLEAIVASLLPTSRREQVLGDLKERCVADRPFTSARYILDAVSALPHVWWTAIRRLLFYGNPPVLAAASADVIRQRANDLQRMIDNRSITFYFGFLLQLPILLFPVIWHPNLPLWIALACMLLVMLWALPSGTPTKPNPTLPGWLVKGALVTYFSYRCTQDPSVANFSIVLLIVVLQGGTLLPRRFLKRRKPKFGAARPPLPTVATAQSREELVIAYRALLQRQYYGVWMASMGSTPLLFAPTIILAQRLLPDWTPWVIRIVIAALAMAVLYCYSIQVCQSRGRKIEQELQHLTPGGDDSTLMSFASVFAQLRKIHRGQMSSPANHTESTYDAE